MGMGDSQVRSDNVAWGLVRTLIFTHIVQGLNPYRVEPQKLKIDSEAPRQKILQVSDCRVSESLNIKSTVTAIKDHDQIFFGH